tara:strand:- start:1400 stop:1606 length:207 start_codon:yes stop_codon:yes gene_type:complete
MSKHLQLENSYNKTISVIESCKTKDQLEGASRMVENFKTLYSPWVGYPKLLLYGLNETLNKQHTICQL